MRKVLAILASPRVGGNCEIISKFIAQHIPGGVELSLVRLPSKNIRPCRACYRCLVDRCPQEDDFMRILDAILNTDGLIVAVPSYIFGENATLKLFLDRGLHFYSIYRRLMNKPAIGIGIAGMRNGEGYTMLALRNFLLRVGADIKGLGLFYAALPGEILLDEENLKKARSLASALFGEHLEDRGWIKCTVCKGTSFDFIEQGILSCLICGTRFNAVFQNGSFYVKKIEDTGVDLFSLEKMEEHRQWLLSMKERFLERRKTLKEITEKFRGGNFI